jgi:hypothetical protein
MGPFFFVTPLLKIRTSPSKIFLGKRFSLRYSDLEIY